MNWKVWYFNASPVLVSSFDEWKELSDGIQGIVEYEDQLKPDGNFTRVLISGGDWYWWHEGRIAFTKPNFQRYSWFDPPEEVCSSCLKKSGIWLPDEEWNKITIAMMESVVWQI